MFTMQNHICFFELNIAKFVIYQHLSMKKTVYGILFFLIAVLIYPTNGFGQRSNYNEDDVVIMRSQQNVGANIMKLLEDKMVDSALFYFKDKSAATKAKLTKISTAIQQYKSKYDFASSPDAPDNEVNHVICKYTSDEGVKTHYKVVFIFGRFDKAYKASGIIFK